MTSVSSMDLLTTKAAGSRSQDGVDPLHALMTVNVGKLHGYSWLIETHYGWLMNQ